MIKEKARDSRGNIPKAKTTPLMIVTGKQTHLVKEMPLF